MSEVWRVSTPEGIFESDLETLKQWISEGCVLPGDKVTKGNMSWIDAARVPQLKGAFSGETTPATQPPSLTTDVCSNHPEAAPKYVCRTCGAVFCNDCPKFVRERVPICSLCGDLCREYQAVTEKAARAELQSSGFGIEDFGRAIRYPLQHKFALFSGALIYAFLLLAGLRGSILGWVIMFACISNVISQVAWGRLHRSFIPDFSEFSVWEDVFVPAFLGVGIMIVSWGPVIVLVLALVFGALNSGAMQTSSDGAMDQVEESFNREDFGALTDPNADPKKLEAANKKLQELRAGAQVAREAEESKAEANDPAGALRELLPYLGGGISIILLLLLLTGWGVFYYPMALTVAGYTQSLGSVLNPVVGLDTIRRMRTTYFKAFAMVILVQVVALVVGVIVSFITSPLTLPFMGNLAGYFINAIFTFYFNLVIACVLGLSLFKCAHRLGITVD